tara:strand:- start:2137 stop:3783 length:1647 start_codon:yes stop_codon:yes gene_type:complete
MQSKKILVLRNYTIEPVFNELKNKFKVKNINISFDFSSYDSALPEILKMNSAKLVSYDSIFIFFSIEAMLSVKKKNESNQSVKNYKKLILEIIYHLKKSGVENIVLFYFFNKKFLKFSINKKNIEKFYLDINKNNRINIQIFNLTKEINFFLPTDKIFDKRYWDSSMFPFNGNGLKITTNILYNKIQQILKFKYKLIILDADNTLWNGVIDEIGYKKINFLNKSRNINYFTFQKNIKKLKNKGLLLALCTKNDFSSIKKVFVYHSKKMKLKLSDFLVIKANWDPKYKNILSLHKKLNLSVENSLFIDDSDFEINSVSNMIPKIDTQNFFEYENFYKNIDKILISNKLKVTEEDKIRNRLYSEEFKRTDEKDKFNNFKNYIKNLNITLKINKNSKKDVRRLAQLTQRTNQFNSSAIRLSELDIKKIIKDPKKMIYQCSAKDKFGDYGIIGLAIIELASRSALVTNFLMSCRALGREIENNFFEYFINEIKKSKINECTILFKKNNKNMLVESFLKKNCKKFKKRNKFEYYKVNISNKKNNQNLVKIING